MVSAGEQGEADADDDRAHAHLQPGADPGGQAPGSGREEQHDDGQREKGQSGLERRVATDDLEFHREQEEAAAEGPVDDEGDQVGDGELAHPEDRRREHR